MPESGSALQLILGVTLLSGFVYVTVNLGVDVVLTLVDPRKAEV